MTRISIAPIVEGHGDNQAVRNLLWRVWTEMLGGEHAQVLTPIRRNRDKLLQSESQDLEKAINFAVLKLGQAEAPSLILILIDAEEDCEKFNNLGPMILKRAKAIRSDVDIACVIANVMYETWFVAAAESLTDYLNLSTVAIPEDPEGDRLGKGWIKKYIRAQKYTETADQAALTAKMDVHLCRKRSPSFDKLCRDLKSRFK